MNRSQHFLCAVLTFFSVSIFSRAEDLVIAHLPVNPPTAAQCSVANPGPRLTIQLSKDGEISILGTAFTLSQLTAIAATISKIDPKARVYLRADKTVATDHVKRVVKACGAGGMNNFIFGGYASKEDETDTAPNTEVVPRP